MEDGKVFFVIFDMKEDFSGIFNGVRKIIVQMEVYVKYFYGIWFIGSLYDDFDVLIVCCKGEDSKWNVCILGMVLMYDLESGFLIQVKVDLLFLKEFYLDLIMDEDEFDLLVVYVEWLESCVFEVDEVIGYFLCNVKWFNVMCFDLISDVEGKCI